MLSALQRMLKAYGMVQAGERVVCAVSGGADSMALLWGMYLLGQKLDIQLEAAHFNHGLRLQEADRDEEHVRAFCDRFDIPLHVGRGSVTAGKKGLEAAARDARYRFLESLPGKIATAHTADDNAETVMMHLVRGTGLKGLGGIAPVRGRIIRPMLGVTRQQVMAFLEEYHVPYVNDSTNAGDAFLRNRLRHHVMPLLQEENPRLAQNLSDMALRLRQDEALLQVPDCFPEGLSVQQLLQLPQGLQSRTVASFLKSCGVKEPDAGHIALVGALARSPKPSARACLPGGVTVCRRYDRLVCAAKQALPQPVALLCPGEAVFGTVTVQCTPAQPGQGVCPVGTPVVRSRRSGDEIRLPGGTKSLKKLFIDRKIPADRRGCIAVVADEMGVLAVEGFGYNLDRCGADTAGVQIKFL